MVACAQNTSKESPLEFLGACQLICQSRRQMMEAVDLLSQEWEQLFDDATPEDLEDGSEISLRLIEIEEMIDMLKEELVIVDRILVYSIKTFDELFSS